jgi:negative regulator of flagellin synthesis FlgM
MPIDINGLGTNQANASKNRGTVAARSSQTSAAPARSSSEGSPRDTVSISAEAKALSQLQDVRNEAPVNNQKVEALRAAIADGSYRPDPQRIADSMLNTDTLF